ncbi:AMP-binding protein, partial [Pseudomonas fluorescens]
PGAEGELWIGGKQVMRGYFDRPDETARHVVSLAGTRFFRTGDIFSYTVDGDLVFHRHDDGEIVWLAGRRTHLSEVRRAALDCLGVEGAVAGVVRRAGRD